MVDREIDPDRTFELLEECSLFRTYKDAFRVATGLPLVLVRGDCPEIGRCDENFRAEFCRVLNLNGTCTCCIDASLDLQREAREEPFTMKCFAGFRETAVPIRYGNRTVAYLKTGEVLDRQPSDEAFEHIAGVLLAEGKGGKEIHRLRDAYFRSPVVDGTRYEGIVVLLSTFGKQLSEHLKDMILSRRDETPLPVRKAVAFIERHLDEHLGLDEVSLEAGLSVSQFCKVFKETTGTTFTEYVNRRRVEWARRELLRPGARVTEIAYKVGFASLSQFNRSFLRFVGEAPRDYRKRRLVEVA